MYDTSPLFICSLLIPSCSFVLQSWITRRWNNSNLNLHLSGRQKYVTQWWQIRPFNLKSFRVLFVHEGGFFQHIDSVILSNINRMKRSCNESRGSWLFRMSRWRSVGTDTNYIEINSHRCMLMCSPLVFLDM